MATNTQSGFQQGRGTVINKTGLTNGDVEITQKFVDSKRARQTKYTVLCSVDGTFGIEKLMPGSETWVEVTKGISHTGHPTDPNHYIIDQFPVGVSRVSFTISDSGADASSTMEVQAESVPR